MELNYMSDVIKKYKTKNQILFSRDSLYLQELLELIRLQSHRTLILWSFMCIEDIIGELKEKYPNEERPANALKLCKAWSRGEVKMQVAKKALLEVHSIAKEIDDPVDIALFHAIGQGCAVVHVETHAIGLPIYELTAIVRKYGINNCEDAIKDKINLYIKNLKICEKEIKNNNLKWADFLQNDNIPNKEMMLF